MKKSLFCVALLSLIGLAGCDDGNDGADGNAGQDGLNSLVSMSTLPFGSEACWMGGRRTDTGLDRNRNGTLDAGEITDATTECRTHPQFATLGVRPDYELMAHIAPVLDDVRRDRNIEFRRGGFGSDTAAHPTIANRFYAITDRGPNADLKTDYAPTGKRFPDPDYVPRIGEFEVTAEGRVVKVREILLKDRNGDTITGLPNPAGLGYTNEVAFGPDGQPLRVDPTRLFDATTNPTLTDRYGLDAEGLVALADGSFWVSDEYGPHMIRFDAHGVEIDRINPFAADDRRVGGYLLPAEFAKRRPNRGMEGLTLTPDGRTLVGIMQSAMSHPNGPANKSNLTRIVAVDLQTKAVAQYLYRQGLEGENVSGQEFSNSAIVALSNTSFLVLERDGAFYRDTPDAFKRVYKIDLRTATNLETVAAAGSVAQDAALGLTLDGQTLEQVIVAGGPDDAFKAGWNVLAAAGIQPASKTLVVDMIEKVQYPHDKMEGLWVINRSTLGVMNDDDFALWVHPVTFALQQKYLDDGNTVIDGNTLYVIEGLDLNPVP